MTKLENGHFYTDEKFFPCCINSNSTEIGFFLTESGTIKVVCNANNKNILIKPSSGNSVEIIAQ